MNYLYLILIVGSFVVPVMLSFDKKLHFYTRWKVVWPVIILVAITYLLVDVFFTDLGVWGFNDRYHIGLKILDLPLEEWLFFLFIPYVSLFIHYSFFLYFPQMKLKTKTSKRLTLALFLAAIVNLIVFRSNDYTLYILILLLLALAIGYFDKLQNLNKFYVSFLIILLPFFIVNGILTGSIIEEPVVWYDEKEITGLRIVTIPLEDFIYAFTLIFFNLYFIEYFSMHSIFKKR
jgi:lycopene cyclase domain-containing protein